MTSRTYDDMNADEWQKITTGIGSVATATVVLLGGIAAFFKYIKGRVHALRLEPKVSGTVVPGKTTDALVITYDLRNIGITRLGIDREASFVKVYACVPALDLQTAWSPVLELVGAFDAFAHHGAIESGEVISDQILVESPKDKYKAFKLELTVTSKKTMWMDLWGLRRTTWTAESVVSCDPVPDRSDSPSA